MIVTRLYFKLKTLLREMNTYLSNDNISEEELYDIIFPQYSNAVRDMIPNFTWYDPDASYREDVEAFVHAVEDKIEFYEKLND